MNRKKIPTETMDCLWMFMGLLPSFPEHQQVMYLCSHGLRKTVQLTANPAFAGRRKVEACDPLCVMAKQTFKRYEAVMRVACFRITVFFLNHAHGCFSRILALLKWPRFFSWLTPPLFAI